MDPETKKEEIERALDEIEWGLDEEVERLEDILRELPEAVKHGLINDGVCSEVEIREVIVRNRFIIVKLECDGESYSARWEWDSLTLYTAAFSRLD